MQFCCVEDNRICEAMASLTLKSRFCWKFNEIENVLETKFGKK